MRTIAERNADLYTVLRTVQDATSKQIRCACPGIVQSWNAANQTVTVKCAIKEVLTMQGTETETEIPLLVDVPVVMPRAGGYSLIFVPQVGDECLVVFSDMCIDSWYQSGGIQSQAEHRRHDLSDAFAILGCWSQARKVQNYPTEGMSLRKDDGTAAITFDASGVHFTGFDVGVKDLSSNDNGVAVGQATGATEGDKRFEVAADHKVYIYGQSAFTGAASFAGGITVMGDITEAADTWTDISSSLIHCAIFGDADRVYIRRFAGMVSMYGAVKLTSALANNSLVQIMTLSEMFRPKERIQQFAPSAAGTTSYPGMWIVINPDGTVNLRNLTGSSFAANGYTTIQCNWGV